MTAWWTFMHLLALAHQMADRMGYSPRSCAESIDRLVMSCALTEREA